MIDLHCHYLPGVDDGPDTAEEALALAQAAVAQGIRAAVLTPHVHPGRYAATRYELEAGFAAFQALLAARGVALELRLGCEMRLSAEAIELLGRDEVPFVGTAGAYRVLLVEFPHDTIPAGSRAVVEHLIARKIRPLIAHPERNKAVMRNPELIRPFVDAGCWLQLTAASLTGGFGRSALRAAEYLLAEELAWVVATDAHNLQHRPPLLAKARAALVPLVGERMAHRLVDERPGRIFAGEGAA